MILYIIPPFPPFFFFFKMAPKILILGVLCTQQALGVLCTQQALGVLCTQQALGVLCTQQALGAKYVSNPVYKSLTPFHL